MKRSSINLGEGFNSPLISVILPFYNAEKNLEEAVGSIIEQDYQNLEILLVDDASADSSLRIAEELGRKDSRIKILSHGENQGTGPARNTGVNDASGEHLFFLDSDDILRRGALRLLQEVLAREDAGVVIGSCDQVDEKGIISDHDRNSDLGRAESFGVIDGEEAVRRWLGVADFFIPVRPWGILINNSLYRSSGLSFFPGEHEDLSLTPFLYKFAGKVVYLEDIVLTYRIRKGSIIHSPQSIGKINRYYRVWDVTSERIELFGLEEYRREFRVFHIGHLFWLLGKEVCSREILEAAAGLIRYGITLPGGESRVGDKRNLAFLVENAARILKESGEERNFMLWESIVYGIGDEILFSFIQKKTNEIRDKIWRVQMSDDMDRDELLQLRSELPEAEIMNEQQDHEISGLKAENERLRKRLMEVSFYLNTLLTEMDRRTAVSNDRVRRPRRFGIKDLRPATFFRVVKRLPGIRSFQEAGVIKTIRESGQFSPEFYRKTYSDLGDYQGDLLLHFVRYGGYEGRSPNLYLDSKWYLNANPGVKRKGINPLYHYLKIGRKEGLWPSPDYSPAEYGELIKHEDD